MLIGRKVDTMSRMVKTLITALLVLLFGMQVLAEGAVPDNCYAPDYSIEVLPDGDGSRQSRAAHEAAWYAEELVYERMMALRSDYPEGMPWTNDNSYGHVYAWRGGEYDGWNISYTGRGCVAFALIMSDAGFGDDLPLWQLYDVPFSDIRVGDILRINNDTHSVIITAVNQSSVTIAEGNYNRSIHWGRTMSAQAVENADYVLSRWPGVPELPNTFTVSYDANGGTGAPAAQTKRRGEALTLSGVRPQRSGWFFLGWSAYRDAARAAYQPGAAYIIDEEITLYAVWAKPDFVLPSSLKTIQSEAFRGGAFRFVKVPEGTKTIGANAFADCMHLEYAYIPAATTNIDTYAFGTKSAVTIIGHSGSAAEAFAQARGFTFIPVS